MFRLIRWLITGDGHQHDWVEYKSADIVSEKNRDLVGYLVVLQCTYCGKLKMHQVEQK